MKLSDFVRYVVVDPRKLTDYALNPHNERGRHKARVFEQVLGYTQDTCEGLLRQIRDTALDGEAHLVRVDSFGRHIRVDLEIVGTRGQTAIVRTGWLVPTAGDEALLVTLYVRE